VQEPAPSADDHYRRRLSRTLIGLAVAALLALAWTSIVATSNEARGDARPLPAFSLPDLDSGEAIDGDSLAGQVTVLNFWASWCPPCRSEAPVLTSVARATEEDGVRFLGILHRDQREPAIEFVEQFGLDFPTAIDDGSLATALGVRSIPTTFVVDAQGRVVARHFGPIREARLRVLIEDAIASSQLPAHQDEE
jgi:cytochrome c biogenesis protein CcmG, thiol:disulfide interchange protein DsbE